MTDEQIKTIVAEIGVRFRTFGGGVGSESRPWHNPIAEALKDTPLSFAAGVPVEQVVRFVLEEAKRL